MGDRHEQLLCAYKIHKRPSLLRMVFYSVTNLQEHLVIVNGD